MCDKWVILDGRGVGDRFLLKFLRNSDPHARHERVCFGRWESHVCSNNLGVRMLMGKRKKLSHGQRRAQHGMYLVGSATRDPWSRT